MECAVKEVYGFRDTREKIRSKGRKIFGRLKTDAGRSNLRFNPRISFTIPCAALQTTERSADFSNLIAPVGKGNGRIQIASRQRLDSVPDRPEFMDNVHVEQVRGNGERHQNTQSDHQPSDEDSAVSL